MIHSCSPKTEVKNLLKDLALMKRISIDYTDEYITERDRLIEILSEDEDNTITILNSLDKDSITTLSQFFLDISKNLKSKKFLVCIEKLQEKFNLNFRGANFYSRLALYDQL